MATAAKRKHHLGVLATSTRDAADALIMRWQEAFGGDTVRPRDAGRVIDALLELRFACMEVIEEAE